MVLGDGLILPTESKEGIAVTLQDHAHQGAWKDRKGNVEIYPHRDNRPQGNHRAATAQLVGMASVFM